MKPHLDAHTAAVMLDLPQEPGAVWGYVELTADDPLQGKPRKLLGIGCLPPKEDGPAYVAAVWVGGHTDGSWFEPSILFRESLVNVWDCEAREQLLAQVQDDAECEAMDRAADLAEVFA